MRFRPPPKRNVGINISPLIDVVFLLVIFFAVSTTFLETAGLKLQLPTSTSTAEREVKEITVLLGADGVLSMDGESLEWESMRERLAAALEDAERKIVVLQADKSTPHGEVVRVMDLIRESGAEGLTIAARAAVE